MSRSGMDIPIENIHKKVNGADLFQCALCLKEGLVWNKVRMKNILIDKLEKKRTICVDCLADSGTVHRKNKEKSRRLRRKYREVESEDRRVESEDRRVESEDRRVESEDRRVESEDRRVESEDRRVERKRRRREIREKIAKTRETLGDISEWSGGE